MRVSVCVCLSVCVFGKGVMDVLTVMNTHCPYVLYIRAEVHTHLWAERRAGIKEMDKKC